MLKKINRISKRKDFEMIKRNGIMYHFPLFSFIVSRLNDEDKKQFGFIVSKKISKRAVDRNRIKRLLSESIKINLNNFNNIKGVFLVKKMILEKKMDEINEEVMKLSKQLK